MWLITSIEWLVNINITRCCNSLIIYSTPLTAILNVINLHVHLSMFEQKLWLMNMNIIYI